MTILQKNKEGLKTKVRYRKVVLMTDWGSAIRLRLIKNKKEGNLFVAEVAEPLGMFYAVEGGVLGGAAEGSGVGIGEGFQLGFALVGEGIAHCGCLVVGAGKLADVAAEGIA